MRKETKPIDPQSTFCEVCLEQVPKSEALMSEGADYVAHFCGTSCYARWRGEEAAVQPAPPEVQEGLGRSVSRDERMKRLTKQHPQRDEPNADSVEDDELPK